MEGGSTTTHPRTVEEVFEDFKGRRAGILKALTSDVEDFFLQCDTEKEALSLYGFPDEGWEVNSSTKEVPPELPEPPEPALGINFARDRMQRKDWLSLVAAHSDSWMLAVSYFYSSHLGQDERKRLILLITELPTVFDVVTGKKPAGKKPSVNSTGESKSEPAGSKIHRAADAPVQKRPRLPKEQGDLVEEDEEEHGNDKFCAWQFCPDNYSADEFRRGCDFCEKWYHGKCIKITPAMNEHIKRYRCPSCSTSRARMQ